MSQTINKQEYIQPYISCIEDYSLKLDYILAGSPNVQVDGDYTTDQQHAKADSYWSDDDSECYASDGNDMDN